jgi:enterochelin esterase-like enzyme
MLEPQSTALFVVLVLTFGALMGWMIMTRRAALRVVSASLAFVIATAFGVLAVNKYYGYYETWGAALGDLTGQGVNGVSSASPVPGSGPVSRWQLDSRESSEIYGGLARQQGYTLRLVVTGRRSHLTRVVYVYLPPQYFRPAYSGYRFPAIELLHGQPGAPQDWINLLGVTVTLDHLVTRSLARPVVLVMPDANGGEDVSLQCLNQAGGAQDLTYLAQDVPSQITRLLRVQPPGPAWGVAGYSEGGFCAANLALRFRHRYGFSGVLSGYFSPFDNQLAHPFRQVSPFRGSRRLRRANTPLDEVQQLPAGAVIPRFWLAAGTADKLDTAAARFFRQELQLRQADVPLTLTPGGGHDMTTWRAEIPPMLAWMSRGLAQAAWAAAAAQAAQADAAAQPARSSRGGRANR